MKEHGGERREIALRGGPPGWMSDIDVHESRRLNAAQQATIESLVRRLDRLWKLQRERRPLCVTYSYIVSETSIEVRDRARCARSS